MFHQIVHAEVGIGVALWVKRQFLVQSIPVNLQSLARCQTHSHQSWNTHDLRPNCAILREDRILSPVLLRPDEITFCAGVTR